MIAYNKVAQLADFDALESDWFSIYLLPGKGREYRKEWEVVTAVRGLREFGAIHPQARLLGVGAGTEFTSYYLTNHAEQVFVTDLYLGDGGWPNWADPMMVKDPSPWSLGHSWDRQRMVVQHMNGCTLHYPNNFFDGIYSSSSIEHFGTLDDVARSACEMGRVLKPGGVMSISTEYWLGGTVGDGWLIGHAGGVILFNRETIQRYIVEPSGCTMVEEFDETMDADTLNTVQNLDWVINIQRQKLPTPTPHVVLEYNGYIFTSASLVLRKPA